VEKAEAEELLLRDCLERGGSVLFLTLTFPHDWGMDFGPMRKAVAAAWRAMTSYTAWKKLRDQYELEWTKCCEDTHGGNGWHPHLHALLRVSRDLTEDEVEQLQATIYGMWARQMERRGYRTPAQEHCPLERMKDAEKAAKYIAKLGLSMEVSSPTTKQARSGHRSPWQILENVGERARPLDIALWREWEVGIKGKAFVTRCKASQARLKAIEHAQAVEDELEEAMDEVVTIATLRRKAWAKVRHIWGMGTQLLNAAERAGRPGVERVLARLDWPEGYDPLVPTWEDGFPDEGGGDGMAISASCGQGHEKGREGRKRPLLQRQ